MTTSKNTAAQSTAKFNQTLKGLIKSSDSVYTTLSDLLVMAGRHYETYSDAQLLARALTAVRDYCPPSHQKGAVACAQAWATDISGHSFSVRDGAYRAGKKQTEGRAIRNDEKPFVDFQTEVKEKAEQRSAQAKATREKKALEKEEHDSREAVRVQALERAAKPLEEAVKLWSDHELKNALILIQNEIESRLESVLKADQHRQGKAEAIKRSRKLREQTAAIAA